MAALTGERDTPKRHSDYPFGFAQKGNTKIYSGALAMADAGGFAVRADDTAACHVLGRANQTGDTTATNPTGSGIALADGIGMLEVEAGVFEYDNPVNGGNQLTQADVGGLAYVLTDHEVTRAAGTNHSVIAGKVVSADTVAAKAVIDTRIRAI